MDPTSLNNAMMAPALAQLRDIRGIDGVPWWPPALGWWLILAAIVLVALAIYHWRTMLRLRVPIPGITLGSWRWDAAHALRALRKRAAEPGEDSKVIAGELSELLRRIAMARLGRDACAGLTGRAWLDWLKKNDPAGFDWPARGGLLLDMPYAPPGHGPGGELQALIDAAYAWVTVSDRKEQGGSRRIVLLLRSPQRRGRESTGREGAREGAGA